MRVISMRTDQCLDEGQSYEAEFQDGCGEDGVVVVYYRNLFEDEPVVRKCLRVLHESVIPAWNPRPNDPWNFGL